MKIIHCSDIHLDSRMESNLTGAQARERNTEICLTFGRLARTAREQGVQAVIIAGDLFDTERVTAQTAGFVLDTIRSVPEVDFLYLRGNHDASGFEGMDCPGNLKTFGTDWTCHRYGHVVIGGMELDGGNWATCYDTLKLPEDTVNVVTLHGQIATQPGEDLLALPMLKQKHIDYLALGHIHGFQTGKLDDRGSWCYCGCLEGRGFDECGEKGFVLLEVEENRVEYRFIPFAARQLREVPVDISGLTTVTELRAAMEAAGGEIPSSDLVKFTLQGTYTLETQKDLGFLKKAMEASFYFVKIKDESRLLIDRRSYEHDASLKGEFIRTVMASDRTDEEKEAIICCGIRALSGEEVAL